jgi:hypothetical protein
MQTILEKAAYHTELLTSIAELDYVPTAQLQQSAFLKDLESQLEQGDRKLKELSETTAKLRKDHQHLHDSTARRLMHKVTGRGEKFAQRESAEERYCLCPTIF